MTGTDVEVHGGTYGIDGLEDVDAGDLAMPILSINHTNGTFVHSLTKAESTSLDVIALGVAKQRILWPPDPGEPGIGPLCRSYDHDRGYPDGERLIPLIKKEKLGEFTNDKNVTFTMASAAEVLSGDPISCDDCPLKEWGTHPKAEGPWCNEQYTFPVLVRDEDGIFSPAIVSFQRSAIRAVKAWISSFVGAKRPMYSRVSRMTLSMVRKGKTEYAVPEFTQGDPTGQELWPSYSAQFHSIQGIITTPRRRDAEETTEETTATDPVPAPQPPAAPVSSEVAADSGVPAAAPKRSTPSAAPAPAARTASDYGDEEPF